MGDLLTNYLNYSKQYTGEVPIHYARWAYIVGLGALLGRQYYLPFGFTSIYPNIYAMLIGSPGTRKGTAIKEIQRHLKRAGYYKFAAERTSKEKFLLDMAADEFHPENGEDILDKNLFGNLNGANSLPDSEVFIAIDEFNDFIGPGNIEFMSMLGNLWNYEGVYENKVKSGKSTAISNPTISILGGNTPTGFRNCFPVDIIGQGFLSRLILIYGEPNGKRITIPPTPTTTTLAAFSDGFKNIKSKIYGPARIDREAEQLIDRIYKANVSVDDFRFESYSNRRLDQLLKLCLILSASRLSSTITLHDVVYANTILTHTEHFMPKALGEFGRARNSDVTHKVMQIVYSAPGVTEFKDIWKQVHSDLEDMNALSENTCESYGSR
jgi:hypothetical protein